MADPQPLTDADRARHHPDPERRPLGQMMVEGPLDDDGERDEIPYVADEPAPIAATLPDNPLNPKGQPSLSLPQQTTPLTSLQGALTAVELADEDTYAALLAQDGLAPDNPLNPKGTPDFIVEGFHDPHASPRVADTTPGPPYTYSEPLTGTPHFDNPKNPRGIPSSATDGAADAQATTDQKTQNPTPQRQPQAATVYPDGALNLERVSAGQNRKPPVEIIP